MKQSKVIFLLAVLVVLVLGVAAAEAKSQLEALQGAEGDVLPIAQNVELVRHWGGSFNSMLVQGSYAYLSVGSDLQIFSLADPINPVLVGSLYVDNAFWSAYASGDYLYISSNGLTIVDVSNPAVPVWVSSFHRVGLIKDMVASGDYLYLATSNGLEIVDVSDPRESSLISRSLNQPVDNIFLEDGYAYMNNGEEVFIWDVSNPSYPIEVYWGELDNVVDMVLGDHYLYILKYESVLVLDVTNPAEPEEVATYLFGGDDRGNEIALEGDYLFILDTFWDEVTILNVANPAMPQWVITYRPLNTYLYSMQLNNGYVYLIRAYIDMVILDATTPTNPFQVNLYSVGSWPTYGEIAVDDYLYFGNGEELKIYELSDPLSPSYLSTYSMMDFQHWTPWSGEVVVQDDFAYLINWWCADYGPCQWYYPALEIVDVSDPLTPTLASTSTDGSDHDTGAYFRVKVFDDYAFLLGDKTLLFDVTNPFGATLLLSFPDEEVSVNPVDIAVADDYFYLAGNDSTGGRVEIVDFTDPAAPILAGSYETPPPLSAVQVVGGYLYVIEGGILHILDISDPAAPVEINRYHHPAYIRSDFVGPLVVEGDYAYVRGNILNISDPANPTLVGFYPLRSEPAVQGEYLYVLSAYEGWYIFKQTPVMVSLAPAISSSLTYTYYQHFPTRFNFPAGAVSEAVTITVNPFTAEDIGGFSFAGHSFGLSAVQGETPLPDFTFDAPVTVTLRYSHEDIGVISNEEELALWVWTEEGWQEATTTCDVPAAYVRDTVNNVLTLTICKTGRFALFGPTYERYFPVVERR